jgi:hypothetical protein
VGRKERRGKRGVEQALKRPERLQRKGTSKGPFETRKEGDPNAIPKEMRGFVKREGANSLPWGPGTNPSRGGGVASFVGASMTCGATVE